MKVETIKVFETTEASLQAYAGRWRPTGPGISLIIVTYYPKRLL
jgi:hypothetical protein